MLCFVRAGCACFVRNALFRFELGEYDDEVRCVLSEPVVHVVKEHAPSRELLKPPLIKGFTCQDVIHGKKPRLPSTLSEILNRTRHLQSPSKKASHPYCISTSIQPAFLTASPTVLLLDSR